MKSNTPDIREKNLSELEKRKSSLETSQKMEMDSLKKRHKRELDMLNSRYGALNARKKSTERVQ
jgi:hypothetical protein